MPPTRIKMAKQTKKQKMTSVGENMEKSDPSCPVGGKTTWCSFYGTQYGGSSPTKLSWEFPEFHFELCKQKG